MRSSKLRGASLCWRCALVMGLIVVAAPVWAETLVIPHILEKSGRIDAAGPATSDTMLYFTLGDLGPTNNAFNQVSVQLFDSVTNALIASTGNVTIDASNRHRTVDFSTLIDAAGGFDSDSVRTGYAVIVVGGAKPENVTMLATTTSHRRNSALASERYISGWSPLDRDVGPGTEPRKTFVLPHLLETAGSIANVNQFDSTLHVVRTSPGSAIGDLFLIGDNGAALQTATGTDVCNPCSFNFAGNARKQSISIDDLVLAKGAFAKTIERPTAVFVATSPGAEFAVQADIQNSHNNANEVSTLTLTNTPIIRGSALPETRRTWMVPHVLDKIGVIDFENPAATAPNTFDTTLFATYTGGLAGPSGPGATLNMYLYDGTGQRLVDDFGVPNCNPCTRSIGDTKRKESYRLDDFITKRRDPNGGLDEHVFALVEAVGDVASVSIDGLIVNSHGGTFGLAMAESKTAKLPTFTRGYRSSRTFVLPHVLETSGRIDDPGAMFMTDTRLVITHTGHLLGPDDSPITGGGGLGSGGGAGSFAGDAFVTVHLMNEDGTEILPGGGAFTFTLDATHPLVSLDLEDIIDAAGGFGGRSPAYATVEVTGNTAYIDLEAMIINSHTGPNDLSIFSYSPQEINLAPVPEPSSLVLAAMGIAAGLAYGWRRRRRAA